MIYNKFKIQDLCHKHNIDILKFDRPVKETSQFVYGKEVHIPRFSLKPDAQPEVDVYKLESWRIKVPYIEDIFEFIPSCRNRLESFMQGKMYEKEPDSMRWKDYTCHQLCDWEFLEDENGVILDSDGYLMLVKYAVILKNELWN